MNDWLKNKTVIVPTDFSDDSARAIRMALTMVDNAAQVRVIHVLFPLDIASPGVMWGQVDDQKREAAVRTFFDEFIRKQSIPAVQFDVRFGDPGLVIADYAKKHDAGLIVIPTHGYHGVKRILLGSVAERVIRHAPCSVLAVRRGDAE
jgi:nucleotide-binding universal stress UspA family protein